MFWGRLTLHEATLAENILDIALKAAEQNHAAKVFKVRLTLGKLAGVEVEA
ncbi:MAG: hydrogenase maturation nickel metallochaperone HypA, partial [Selenomonadaceae bacterium]|nr:hydrogenase maturation nickel metallochaperone HypA [Selenomonadaceae bacterium]